VWSSGEQFLAGREFTRFEPVARSATIEQALAGWHRAVRATLAWARDPGGSPVASSRS
jgi:hypothetical protein